MLFPRNILNYTLILGFLLVGQLSTFAQCDQDTIPPVIMAPADMTLNCILWIENDVEDPVVRNQLFGTATATDNCELTFFTENFLETNNCSNYSLKRIWTAEDASGNLTTYQQLINSFLDDLVVLSFPGDAIPGTEPILPEILDDGCGLMTMTYSDEVYELDCDGEPDEFTRTITTTDWCLYDEINMPPPFSLPRLDIDGDGTVGDAYQAKITSNGIFLWENGQLGDSLAPLFAQYEYIQMNDLSENTEVTIQVQGMVYNDANENCALDVDEEGIINYGIKIKNISNGNTAFTSSDAAGNYEIDFCANGDTVEISSYNPFNATGTCLTTTTIVLSPTVTELTVDLPVQIPCDQLHVDIGTWALRRCFNNKYYVSYQNISAIEKEDVYIDVILDPFLTYTDSEIMAEDLGDNTYRFELGNLTPLASGSFWLKADLSCDAELGQTHCTTATIYPENNCEEENNANWSGASVAITGECEGDSLKITLENVGVENMMESKNYIIVEDVIMMSINPFQLNAGATQTIKLPANGATWHVSAEQVDFHPGMNLPSVTIEGCGGNNNPGTAMNFPQYDADPGVSIDCRINIGSFDPNDKQAAPRGIGAEREIEANVGMEYLIRFQNTGTDTAFTVVIEDELSEFLNSTSVIPGAASHNYVFERSTDNTIRFTFDNIMLPDSTIDLEGSQGFVKFNILQKADNAPGSIINNQAAIYFDFNDPIITNDAFVKISDHPYGVINYISELEKNSNLNIFPNPIQDGATLIYQSKNFEPGQLNIYNINGQLLRSQFISSPESRLEFAGWPKGIYPLEFIIGEQRVEAGKIIIQ